MTYHPFERDSGPSLGRSVAWSKNNVLGTAVILVVFAVGSGCYVYRSEQSKHQRFRQRIGELEQENKKLSTSIQQRVFELRGELKKIKTSLDGLTKSTGDLKKAVESLNDDYTVWDDVIPNIAVANREAEGHVENLQRTVVQLEQGLERWNSKAPINGSLPGDAPPQRYYTNVDGHRVPSPVHADSAPAGATAECRDGTYSFSQNRSGTCSHHGGVKRWLR